MFNINNTILEDKVQVAINSGDIAELNDRVNPYRIFFL